MTYPLLNILLDDSLPLLDYYNIRRTSLLILRINLIENIYIDPYTTCDLFLSVGNHVFIGGSAVQARISAMPIQLK